MSRIVDEDVVGPIKTHAATDAYREGWDRVFGEKEPEPEKQADSDGIEIKVKAWGYYCPTCRCYSPEPHVNGHVFIKIDD